MAAGPPAASSPALLPWPLLLLSLLLAFAMAVEGSPLCSSQNEKCTHKYEAEVQSQGSETCQALIRYMTCVRQNARHCRGDLAYHGTNTYLSKKLHAHNCTDEATPPAGTQAPVSRTAKCDFQGRQEFRHCLLFGDPHLKTFFGEYHTCRVKGAWPLIDNKYLAVQVTNEPVRPNSLATATTKVTILIRGAGHPCAQEKTYEAASDLAALPTTFIDGTQHSSGPEEAVQLRAISPEHVEIRVRYLAAVLVVRQSGRWLSFSARLPVEHTVGASHDDLQLCSRGCPASERLLPTARGGALSEEAAVARCLEGPRIPPFNGSAAVPPLADEYLRWCVFDVMTTGEEEADYFTAAAYHAVVDVMRLDPAALNGTRTRSVTDPPPLDGGSAAAHVPAVLLFVVALLASLG